MSSSRFIVLARRLSLLFGLFLMGLAWHWRHGQRIGRVELRPGETTSVLHRASSEAPRSGEITLPFQVCLRRFDLAPANPAYRLYAYVHPDGRGGFEPKPQALSVKEGQSLKLADDVRLEVERLIPDALDQSRLQENPKGAVNPVMGVLLGLGVPEPLMGRLAARDPERCRQDEPGGRFAVLFREGMSPQGLALLKPQAPRLERLVVLWRGQSLERPVRMGDRWMLPGLTLRTTKLYPDFAVRQGGGDPEAYTRSSEPREPWLEVVLERPGAADRKLLLSARDPESSDRLNAPNLPAGMVIRYQRVDEETQRRFVVFTLSDRMARLVDSGRVVRQEPWVLERPFVLERGLSVTPIALMEHAEFLPDFAPNPNPAPDAARAGRIQHPVIRVRLQNDHGADGGWLEAAGTAGVPTAATFLGGRVALVYRAEDPRPEDCRGDIALLDAAGRTLAQGPIRRDRWLIHGGYVFGVDADIADDPAALALAVGARPWLWVWLLVAGGTLVAAASGWELARWRRRRVDAS
ncbi:MAG TPA: hypothetical protein PKL14_07190 [Holophaga sp.]|nr:hypothetical protein [Holophaga sp.]